MTVPPPLVTAVSMGYGHLRAAHALAEELGVEVARADRGPHAGPVERALWSLARRLYEGVSRGSQGRLAGSLLRAMLDRLTRIGPPPGATDPTRPTVAARFLELLVGCGVGRRIARTACAEVRPLVTTYFVPALAADRLRHRATYCLVTDTDASRAWVPPAAGKTGITFLTPTARVTERLRTYGVPGERIVESGFPLPPALLGGPELPALRRALAARLGRLDPHGAFRTARRGELEELLAAPLPPPDGRPPLLTYAVGGAAAQAGLARRILADLGPAIAHGRLRLCLVAGTHIALAERFARWVRGAGLETALEAGEITILAEPDLQTSFRRVHAALAQTDVLWTKPSEMTFFAALGLPLLLASPVGAQERANRRWALEAGVALPRPSPEGTARLLVQLLDRGALAAAAWAGFLRLPADGLYRICALLERDLSPGRRPARSCRAPSSLRASSS